MYVDNDVRGCKILHIHDTHTYLVLLDNPQKLLILKMVVWNPDLSVSSYSLGLTLHALTYEPNSRTPITSFGRPK